MVALSLKISIGNVVKTMQFEPSTMVYDACRIIRERVPEAQLGQRKWPGRLSWEKEMSRESGVGYQPGTAVGQGDWSLLPPCSCPCGLGSLLADLKPPPPAPPWSNPLAAVLSSAHDFGLFLSDEDPKKGIWLEAGKALDYYMLRNGVSASLRGAFRSAKRIGRG